MEEKFLDLDDMILSLVMISDDADQVWLHSAWGLWVVGATARSLFIYLMICYFAL